MQKITLIGKGFVAKHLLKCFGDKITLQYDSKSIESISEKNHEIVFCAAPSAKKWIANADPVSDFKSCNTLIESLKKTKLKKVILFSTVDVYSTEFSKLDENHECFASHAYGMNRKMIEDSLRSNMSCSVVRLPALFGSYLEKNYIFDLMNDNNLSSVKINSSFQWLDLNRINECVKTAEQHDLVNYVVEPLATLEVVSNFFPDKLHLLDTETLGPNYDIRSKHAPNGYFHNKSQVLEDMEKFFDDWHHNGRDYR